MVSRPRNTKSTSPYSSPATLEFMREAEAREWIKRYQEKAKEVGPNDARIWWDRTINHIRRLRGDDAAFDLRQRMNRLNK